MKQLIATLREQLGTYPRHWTLALSKIEAATLLDYIDELQAINERLKGSIERLEAVVKASTESAVYKSSSRISIGHDEALEQLNATKGEVK